MPVLSCSSHSFHRFCTLWNWRLPLCLCPLIEVSRRSSGITTRLSRVVSFTKRPLNANSARIWPIVSYSETSFLSVSALSLSNMVIRWMAAGSASSCSLFMGNPLSPTLHEWQSPSPCRWGAIRIGFLVLVSLVVFLSCYRDWETDRKSTRLNSSH